MATPNLALFPSGRKATKLYSVLPTDGTGDFTVARASKKNEINSDLKLEIIDNNVPAFNFDTIGGCPLLNTEPQGINLITYPISFSNSYWTKSGTSVVSGQSAPSVDFPTSAFKLVEDTGVAQHRIVTGISVTSGLKYTASVYVKDFSGNRKIQLNNDVAGINSYFDLTTLAITNILGVGKYTAMADGWYKFEVTGTATSTGVANTYIALANPTETYTGDGTSGVYLFMAQFELGSVATSPTFTDITLADEGSTTTRLADVVTGGGDVNTFSSVNSSGVLFLNISDISNLSAARVISLSDGTSLNQIQLYFDSTLNKVYIYMAVNGAISISSNTTLTDAYALNKIAFRWALNDFSLWVNGVEVITDVSGAIFPALTLDRLNLTNTTGGEIFYGNTKSLQVLPYQTDAEMALLK